MTSHYEKAEIDQRYNPERTLYKGQCEYQYIERIITTIEPWAILKSQAKILCKRKTIIMMSVARKEIFMKIQC